VQQVLQRYKDFRHIAILGMEELSEGTNSRSHEPAKSSVSCRSRTSWPNNSRYSGKYVRIGDTVRSFREILEGKHDDLSEQAFYMLAPSRKPGPKPRKMKA